MYTQNPYMDPMLIVNRNKNYVMQFLCSPVVLVLGILQAVSVAINLFSSSFTTAISAEFLNALNLYINSSGGNTGTDSVTATFSLSLPVVPIAATVAFFLLYFCSKGNKQGNGVNSGATILFILAIFSVISASLLTLFFVFIIFILGLFLPTSLPVASVLLVVIFLVSALIATHALIFSISYLRFTSSLKNSLSTNELLAKGAKTFGVMNVISAVFSVFKLILSAVLFFATLFIPDSIDYNGISFSTKSLAILAAIYLVSSIINFVYYIFSAKFAFGYDKHIAAAGPNGVALPLPVPPMTPPIPDIPFCQPAPTDAMGATEPIAPEQIPEPNEEPSVCEDATVPCEEAVTEAEPTEAAEPAETTGPTEKACGNCGTPMAENQRFCSNCGTPAE